MKVLIKSTAHQHKKHTNNDYKNLALGNPMTTSYHFQDKQINNDRQHLLVTSKYRIGENTMKFIKKLTMKKNDDYIDNRSQFFGFSEQHMQLAIFQQARQ